MFLGEKNDGKTTILKYFVKMAPNDPKWRTMFGCEKCFTREMYMYGKVLPILTELENDHQIKNKLRYPKIYAMSSKSGSETILMEDLVFQNFEMKDRRQPLNLQHCKIVIMYFAKLHSLSFVLKKQNPKLFDEISFLPETFFTDEFMKIYKEKKMETTYTRAAACLDKEKESHIIHKVKNFYDNFIENYTFCVSGKNSNGYNVICHGDSWINNILFKYKVSCILNF